MQHVVDALDEDAGAEPGGAGDVEADVHEAGAALLFGEGASVPPPMMCMPGLRVPPRERVAKTGRGRPAAEPSSPARSTMAPAPSPKV